MCHEQALLQTRSCQRGREPGSRVGEVVAVAHLPHRVLSVSEEDPCDLGRFPGPIVCPLRAPGRPQAIQVVPGFAPSFLPPTPWQSPSQLKQASMA